MPGRVLAIIVIVVCVARPSGVRAAVDLTGTFSVTADTFFGPATGTFTFTQAGTNLELDYLVTAPLPDGTTPLADTLTGTVDPETGAFAFPLPDRDSLFPGLGIPLPPWCKGNGIFGSSATGTAIGGTWVNIYVALGGCVNTMGDFTGVRTGAAPACGDGVVSGVEQCDDGDTADGDCCSATCRLEAAGSPCVDGDPCTTVDACNDVGACVGTTPPTCGPCETCVTGTGCVPGPDPTCTDVPGHGHILLDLSRRRVSADVQIPDGLPARIAGDYGLCVFVSTASGSRVLVSARVPGDARCRGRSCWHSTARRHVYRNPRATADGIAQLALQLGKTPGYRVRGRGANLSLPASLPAGSIGLSMQLRRNDPDGACYRTDFPAVVPRSPMNLHARR